MSVLLIAAYATIGLAVGLAAARYEYRDGAAPGHIDSAGAVGLFAACLWPLVGAMLLIGWVAKATVSR
jgi:hypothetical protein